MKTGGFGRLLSFSRGACPALLQSERSSRAEFLDQRLHAPAAGELVQLIEAEQLAVHGMTLHPKLGGDLGGSQAGDDQARDLLTADCGTRIGAGAFAVFQRLEASGLSVRLRGLWL